MIFRILAPDDGIVNLVAGALGMKSSVHYLMERDYFYPSIKLTMGILFILALGALVASGFEQGNYAYAAALVLYRVSLHC